MRIKIGQAEKARIVREFEVTESEVQRIFDWMNDNHEDFDTISELSEEAILNLTKPDDDVDDDLYDEIAFLFESVVGDG